MARERRVGRKLVKSPEKNSFKLHFNKNCEFGKKINEHLLPNTIFAPTLTKLFHACIDVLICANIDSANFTKALVQAGVVNYTEVTVESTKHLRKLLDKLCHSLKTCDHFIDDKKMKKCRICEQDDHNEDSGPVAKMKKKEIPKKQVKAVNDKKRLAISLKRMDFSKMAARSEITLPPNFQIGHEKTDGVDSVASTSENVEYTVDTVDVPQVYSRGKIPINKKKIVIANHKESKNKSSNAADHSSVSLAEGDWSMEVPATPRTSRFPRMGVDQIVEVLKTSTPNESNATEENVSDDEITTIEDVIEVIENENNAEDAGITDVDMHNLATDGRSGHSTPDNDQDPNEEGVINDAETESRAYDTQDEREQFDDDISEVDLLPVRVDWTPDQVADFILEEDVSLEQFALFIRNERIDGKLIPFISYAFIKDSVTSAPGETLRFLSIVKKLKNLLNSYKKKSDSAVAQEATKTE